MTQIDAQRGGADAASLAEKRTAARPDGLAADVDSILGGRSRSILVGADDFAAIAGRERLKDAVRLAAQVVDPARIVRRSRGGDQSRIPRIDRALDELDGAVAEREVGAAGVITGVVSDEVALA